MSASGQELTGSSPIAGTAVVARLVAAARRRGSLGNATLVSLALVVGMRVVLALVLIGSCGDGHCNSQGVVWYYGGQPATTGWQGLLVGPWQRNDASAYAQIALGGYVAPGQANGPLGTFFPLFPLLIRAVLPLAGGDAILGGLLVNTVLAVVGLTLISRLVQNDLGMRAGYVAQLLVGIGPAVFFMLAPLSEATFFVFTVAAVLAMRRQRLGVAGILAALATLSRPQGILVMIPLVIEAALQARTRWHEGQRPLRWSHATFALPPLALLGFQWYVTGHGYPGGILATEQMYWDVHTVVPGVAVWDSLRFVISRGDVPELVNLLAVVALAAAIPFMVRRLRASDTAYAVASLLLIVSHTNGNSPLMSALRFCVMTYPLWMLLARGASSPRVLRRTLPIAACLTLLVAVGISGYHMVQ